ncbi:MAG: hypothetical protein AB7I27_00325 [Bacteriovoracaceae bacterium]
MLGQLALTIIAVSRAFPKVAELIDLVFELRLKELNARSEREDQIKHDERLALLSAMKNAKDDEERKTIARLLYRNYQR